MLIEISVLCSALAVWIWDASLANAHCQFEFHPAVLAVQLCPEAHALCQYLERFSVTQVDTQETNWNANNAPLVR